MSRFDIECVVDLEASDETRAREIVTGWASQPPSCVLPERSVIYVVQPSQWRVFDKDDRSTWPNSMNQACWLYHSRRDHGEVRFGMWWSKYNADQWQRDSVTHWMPIEVPEPPE